MTQIFATTGLRRRNGIMRRPAMLPESLEIRMLLANHPLTDIPVRNSLPGAPVTIYLDFDGHSESQDWPEEREGGDDEDEDGDTGPILTPVFDTDNDLTTFSDEELRIIEEVWHRVAEDYRPFQVNVTTVNPGTFSDFQAILISIGGNGSWIGSPGGIAYLDSFSNAQVNTVYAFSDNLGKGTPTHAKSIALAASHEAGHAFGLEHHSQYAPNGTKTEYDPGTATLGPIMGAPYDSLRETWNNGPGNVNATTLQDDLAVLTRAANQTFRYRTDDFGGTITTANSPVLTNSSFSVAGVISQNSDVDMFRVEAGTGAVNFSVRGLDLNAIFTGLNLNPGTNLDAVLKLYSATGQEIAAASPSDSLSASISQTVTAGVYYVAVTKTAEYGALGQYLLTGSVTPAPVVPTMIEPVGAINTLKPTFSWTVASGAASYQLAVERLVNGVYSTYIPSVTVPGLTYTAANSFEEGEYRARVRTVSSTGSFGGYSEYIQFSIDIPAPNKPRIIDPSNGTTVNTGLPVFRWDEQTGAASYTLEVTNSAGSRVIFRPNQLTSSYQHFTPLKDGAYRTRVYATNSQGENSDWSDVVAFTIRTATPVAPRITAPVSVTTSQTPRIEWTAVDQGWIYDLWVDNRSANISQVIRETNIQGRTYFDIPAGSPLTQGTYTAYIRAFSINNRGSSWSAGYTFTVDVLPPGQPTVTGPVRTGAGNTVTTQMPVFSWTASPRAVSYELWVNNDTARTVNIYKGVKFTGTSFKPTTPLAEGSYRVWVRAINSVDEVGTWSSVYTFKLDLPAPTIPKFTTTGLAQAPVGTYVYDDLTPTIAWTSSNSSEVTYDLWINNITLKKNQVIRNTTVSGSSYTVPDSLKFRDQDVLEAFIRSKNSLGEFSGWSPAYRFTVRLLRPDTPVIIGPVQTVRDAKPTFTWKHVTGAVKYEILVRDLLNQESKVLPFSPLQLDKTGTVASYKSTQAFSNGTYRFWVRAVTADNSYSSWSSSQTFVISVSASEKINPRNASSADSDHQFVFTSADSDRQTAARPTALAAATENPANEYVSDKPADFLPDVAPNEAAQPDDDAATDMLMELIADPATAAAVPELFREIAPPRLSIELGESGEKHGATAAIWAAVVPVVLVSGDRRRRTRSV